MKNSFKDRVPEEIWMEARNIVQEAATKTIPKKRKFKNAKWLSNEALQIAEKTRETKCKGGRESYQHEFDPTLGGSGRQKGLACSGPWGHEEPDTS